MNGYITEKQPIIPNSKFYYRISSDIADNLVILPNNVKSESILQGKKNVDKSQKQLGFVYILLFNIELFNFRIYLFDHRSD